MQLFLVSLSMLFAAASAGTCSTYGYLKFGTCIELKYFANTTQTFVAATSGFKTDGADKVELVYGADVDYVVDAVLTQYSGSDALSEEDITFTQLASKIQADNYSLGGQFCTKKCGAQNDYYLTYICSTPATSWGSDPIFAVSSVKHTTISTSDFTKCMNSATSAISTAAMEIF